ncbi:transposase [Streptomyces sp. NPDC016566]|uniref:transposase n=1 Tax=Streptomyces sp. NPDC016566 TaxID=3364967 RepID=UPI0036FDDA55
MITKVAREFGVGPESLRTWVRREQANRGEGLPGELAGAEREELKRLCRQNREQQQTRSPGRSCRAEPGPAARPCPAACGRAVPYGARWQMTCRPLVRQYEL